MSEKDTERKEDTLETEGGFNRRDFVQSSAILAAGVATFSYGGSAMAQDYPVIGTPDWRTLSPGTKDSDLYAEEAGFADDAALTWWDGRNVGGVTVGVIQYRANLPMMPGNMGNATTFDFPLLWREMPADNIVDVAALEPTKQFTEAAIEAAKWLELQGVRAITTNCGLFGTYQKVIQAEIDTPFFSSSLIQLPIMLASMPGNKRLA